MIKKLFPLQRGPKLWHSSFLFVICSQALLQFTIQQQRVWTKCKKRDFKSWSKRLTTTSLQFVLPNSLHRRASLSPLEEFCLRWRVNKAACPIWADSLKRTLLKLLRRMVLRRMLRKTKINIRFPGKEFSLSRVNPGAVLGGCPSWPSRGLPPRSHPASTKPGLQSPHLWKIRRSIRWKCLQFLTLRKSATIQAKWNNLIWLFALQ